MRKIIASGLLFLSGIAGAQSPQNPQPTPQTYTRSLRLPMQNPPTQVPSGLAQRTGNPGNTTYFYWVVAKYPVGDAMPAGPYVVLNSADTLSGSNYNTVIWTPALGATSYDVLRTTVGQAPSGACNCAVATAVTGSTQADQSNSLSAYTVNTFDVNSSDTVLTNEPLDYGRSHMMLRQQTTARTEDLSVLETDYNTRRYLGQSLSDRIIACIADLPATGGGCDARGELPPYNINSDIFADVTKPGALRLPYGNINVNATINIPASTSANPANWTIAGSLYGGYFGNTQSVAGTVLVGTSTLGANPILKAFRSQRGYIHDLSFDATLGGSVCYLGHTDVTGVQGAQDNQFERLSFLNCPIAMQFGDSGASSAGQFDRVLMSNIHIGAPAIQATATGIVIDSSNAMQTSPLNGCEITQVHIGIDIQHLETGQFDARNCQNTIFGGTLASPAALVKIANMRNAQFHNFQAEGTDCDTAVCSTFWFTGPPDTTGVTILSNNTFNFPVFVDVSKFIVSMGNQGNFPIIAYGAGARILSLGDRIGSGSANLGWAPGAIAPAYAMNGTTRTGGVVTGTMPSYTVTNVARAGSYSTVTLSASPTGISQWQKVWVHGTTADGGSFNSYSVVTKVDTVANTVTFLQYTKADVPSTPDTGTVQALVGFPDQSTVDITNCADTSYTGNAYLITVNPATPWQFTYSAAGADGPTTGCIIRSEAQIAQTTQPNLAADLYPLQFNAGRFTGNSVAEVRSQNPNSGLTFFSEAPGGGGAWWGLFAQSNQTGGDGNFSTAGAYVLRYCAADESCATGTNEAIFNGSTNTVYLLAGVSTTLNCTPSNGFCVANGQNFWSLNAAGNTAWPLMQANNNNHMLLAPTASTWTKLYIGTEGSPLWQLDLSTGDMTLATTTFASLGTPVDGTMIYCSDCTAASPTAGGGTGTVVRRENGQWNGGGGGGGVSTVSGTANQIASSGGANPVLSITNPLATPGAIYAGAGTPIDGTTGVTIGLAARVNTSGNLITCTTAQASSPDCAPVTARVSAGVFTSTTGSAFTTGNGYTVGTGTVTVTFDGATTAGDCATLSGTTNGQYHDAGACSAVTSGVVRGVVLSTNAGPGNYAMLMAQGFQASATANGSIIRGYCSGTIGTANATTYVLQPYSQATSNVCTSTSPGNRAGIPMPYACTAKNLRVTASAPGGQATSGTVALYKGGVVTALTCALGTGTSCSDLTHTVSLAAGDVITLEVTTAQATDTTANIRAALQCQ